MNKGYYQADTKKSKVSKGNVGFFDFDSDDFLNIGWSDSELYEKDILDSDDQSLLVDLDNDVEKNMYFGSLNSRNSICKSIDKSLVIKSLSSVKRLTFKLNEIVPLHTLVKMVDF